MTTPSEFAKLSRRPGARCTVRRCTGRWPRFAVRARGRRLPGLYLAGGSVHPGPGLPMAALSGRIAATSILEDQTSN